MESLNPKEFDSRLEDFCNMKRPRSVSEIKSSCEVSPIPAKDSSKLSESSDRRMVGKSEDREMKEDKGRSKCVPHGWISVIGRRRAMEDAVAVAEFNSYHFFAVYDGHGGAGVANTCRDRLHQLLDEEVEDRIAGSRCGGAPVEWEKVMRAGFRKMDEEVCCGQAVEDEEDGGRAVTLNTVGSTAVVVIVGQTVVVVANCGDSRAVLCRDGFPVPLSRDHKPDRPDERQRVKAAGGRIIDWNGYRVLGVLATSRSIGDHYLKPYVIAEPEVTIWERTESDQFLVIASDGLWDVVSNEFVCEVVRRCFDGQIRRRCSDGLSGNTAAEAAALLAELAMARGSKDNISVIVVDLKK